MYVDNQQAENHWNNARIRSTRLAQKVSSLLTTVLLLSQLFSAFVWLNCTNCEHSQLFLLIWQMRNWGMAVSMKLPKCVTTKKKIMKPSALPSTASILNNNNCIFFYNNHRNAPCITRNNNNNSTLHGICSFHQIVEFHSTFVIRLSICTEGILMQWEKEIV